MPLKAITPFAATPSIWPESIFTRVAAATRALRRHPADPIVAITASVPRVMEASARSPGAKLEARQQQGKTRRARLRLHQSPHVFE